MIAVLACIAAFIANYWAGRRSLGKGLLVLVVVGYFYGIIRANLITTFSHFIFDAAALGLYLSQTWFSTDSAENKRSGPILWWTLALAGWCCLLVLLPFQPLLVSLVGLRGSIFFLPIMVLGAKLKDRDLLELGAGLAILNLVAAAFAWAEYFMGVPRFYPISPVTQIIYASGDVTGGFLRIPAIFSSAHAYGGSMVVSLPYLIGCWDRARVRLFRILMVLGIGAALLGVLMSATRQNFVLAAVMVIVTLLMRRAKPGAIAVFALLIVGLGWAALTNERFQRFKSLTDTEGVVERIAGSVNHSFWEILTEYPMGNGLGGGGTSIPYFLQSEVRNPIGMENEYARILSEQGVIGLLLWISFVVWFLSRARIAFAKVPWANSRRMAWCLAAFSLGTAWIGLGFLTSIPQTAIQLLGIGWTTALPMGDPRQAQRDGAQLSARVGSSIPVLR
jgi:hypothetical protein